MLERVRVASRQAHDLLQFVSDIAEYVVILSSPWVAIALEIARTLAVIEDELGDAPVTGAGLAGVVAQRWHHASPATWNRHVATVRSFARYCERTRILEIDGALELQRRAEKHDHTRSVPSASLERLWERRDIDLRERTLWRMLYETAARANEVLRLDIEDLDIPAQRARTHSKGGDVDWLFFASGSARLLPRLIAGRRAGPVFLSSLRPSPARDPAAGDLSRWVATRACPTAAPQSCSSTRPAGRCTSSDTPR
jgi:integrase